MGPEIWVRRAIAGVTVSNRLLAPLPRPGPDAERPRPAAALPTLASAEVGILDELDKVNPVTGEMIPSQPDGYRAANHFWDAAARQITRRAARNEFVAFQMLLRGDFPVGSIKPELVFDEPAAKAVKIEMGRYQPIASKLGPLPDPIIPLSFTAGAEPSVKRQSLHNDLYVPHGLAAGEYHATLSLRGALAGSRASYHGDHGPLRLPVVLRIWDFTLPDHLSLLPEMNCYSLPENERDYYRLAHRHRTVLNRLPYNQNSRMQDGGAPRWERRRHDFDWSAWDRRFGPLLDGSAFADLPRTSVPVECFCLPLHENWPSSMEGNYNGDYWADRAFPASYCQAFVAAARQNATHLHAKHWTETLFQGFLNNKHNFKANGWSRGSSPWLLDEPANFQDYWALRYFARAFHQGINQAADTGPQSTSAPPTNAHFSSSSVSSAPRLVFRADISRPQWRRDSLDGLLDYHVVGAAVRNYPRLVFERKRALGEIVLEYGSTNSVEGSNVQPVGWCLDAWSLGTDGIIPWQTVGTAGSWERADERSLFYPGRGGSNRSGSGAVPTPIPSIRLKAYRRGQQDVEYLALWSRLRYEPRWAVGQQARAASKLAGSRQSTGFTGAEDAGRVDYARLRPQDVWALRVALGEALSRAHLASQSELVEFRTPRRDPDRLLPGYVGEAQDLERGTHPSDDHVRRPPNSAN